MKTNYHALLTALGFHATERGDQEHEVYTNGHIDVEVALYGGGQKLLIDNEVIATIDNTPVPAKTYTLTLYWLDEDGNIQSRTGEYCSFETAALHASKALKEDNYEISITVEDGLESTLERAYAESVRG